jgi:hypothetical protein
LKEFNPKISMEAQKIPNSQSHLVQKRTKQEAAQYLILRHTVWPK